MKAIDTTAKDLNAMWAAECIKTLILTTTTTIMTHAKDRDLE